MFAARYKMRVKNRRVAEKFFANPAQRANAMDRIVNMEDETFEDSEKVQSFLAGMRHIYRLGKDLNDMERDHERLKRLGYPLKMLPSERTNLFEWRKARWISGLFLKNNAKNTNSGRTNHMQVRTDKYGRIRLSKELVTSMGLKPGDRIYAKIKDEQIQINRQKRGDARIYTVDQYSNILIRPRAVGANKMRKNYNIDYTGGKSVFVS